MTTLLQLMPFLAQAISSESLLVKDVVKIISKNDSDLPPNIGNINLFKVKNLIPSESRMPTLADANFLYPMLELLFRKENLSKCYAFFTNLWADVQQECSYENMKLLIQESEKDPLSDESDLLLVLEANGRTINQAKLNEILKGLKSIQENCRGIDEFLQTLGKNIKAFFYAEQLQIQ